MGLLKGQRSWISIGGGGLPKINFRRGRIKKKKRRMRTREERRKLFNPFLNGPRSEGGHFMERVRWLQIDEHGVYSEGKDPPRGGGGGGGGQES